MIRLHTAEEVETLVIEEEITNVGNAYKLVVHNDDHNTFEWVIKCFTEILHHSTEQAEQLSMLIHFKGKATVKTASLDALRPFKTALIDRGLSAVIEK
jgi:ATP-dependent Clp protease adaptor protein ClpS